MTKHTEVQAQASSPSTPSGFTPKEAGNILGISGKKLRRAIRKGQVKGAVKWLGRWYIPADVVDELKAAQAAPAAESEPAEA